MSWGQPASPWASSRRGFLRSALVGAGAMSVIMLERFGGATPAEAGPPVCFDPAGFQYRGGICAPREYSFRTTCSTGGCNRTGLVSHAVNCPSNGAVYKERHRTCGEDRIYNGTHKQFALRLNECGTGGNCPPGTACDGWEWIGTDADRRCGCAAGRTILWSCNDGYVQVPGSGPVPSICMTDACPAL